MINAVSDVDQDNLYSDLHPEPKPLNLATLQGIPPEVDPYLYPKRPFVGLKQSFKDLMSDEDDDDMCASESSKHS